MLGYYLVHTARYIHCQAVLSASHGNDRASELRAHNRIRVKGTDVPPPVSDFDELLPLVSHPSTPHTRVRAHTFMLPLYERAMPRLGLRISSALSAVAEGRTKYLGTIVL